jgi:hypothetical protein
MLPAEWNDAKKHIQEVASREAGIRNTGGDEGRGSGLLS